MSQEHITEPSVSDRIGELANAVLVARAEITEEEVCFADRWMVDHSDGRAFAASFLAKGSVRRYILAAMALGTFTADIDRPGTSRAASKRSAAESPIHPASVVIRERPPATEEQHPPRFDPTTVNEDF